ncbi:carcinoembryonic antigen-related cell adhesion molecule 1-like isoform X2 [Salmo salar]|uniref:Carcinoembryonic antigen-related cell adhesion molecule 1-like isoform X2 n=1 Tax=Salmo salar TaxID=8030 RepID=A0ABM3EUD8_SALSA|nr:carcinoembryonic antigen-related cell adhesion molecule 1-like isoform X2 [Salmo salar]|eukprot:XP_014056832.1 PREDICTED: carcinoembryonic antigen-related cell adhesion molecule 1-like isoform X2 [Salmo salar]
MEAATVVSFTMAVLSVGYRDRINLDRSSGSLELMNLDLTDSGQYTVTILTPEAVSVEENTKLEVYEPISGAIITTSPNPPIIEGNSVNLTCDASGSIITREWMKDGQLLSAGGNLTISEDKRVLSINPVKRTDSGEYLCRVSNLVSTADAKDILLVKSEDSLSPVLPARALTGIVIGVLLVVGGAVSVAVFFIRKNGTNAEPMHQGGSQQLVYENTSPVYENTSPVYENTSPVYENTRQNQSPRP